jgi:hypothetical protein
MAKQAGKRQSRTGRYSTNENMYVNDDQDQSSFHREGYHHVYEGIKSSDVPHSKSIVNNPCLGSHSPGIIALTDACTYRYLWHADGSSSYFIVHCSSYDKFGCFWYVLASPYSPRIRSYFSKTNWTEADYPTSLCKRSGLDFYPEYNFNN